MMDINKLIQKSSKNKEIELYTTSIHIKVEVEIFNQILNTNPEWENAVDALATYTAQKWAQNVRNKLDIRVKDDRYMGIYLQDKTSVETALNVSEEMLNIIESTIEKLPKKYKEILEEIFIKNSDVSKYKVDMYFKEAVERFCEKAYKRIDKLINKLNTAKSLLEDDVAFVVFDMHRLMDLKKDIKYFSQREGDIDYNEFYVLFNETVAELYKYPCKQQVFEATRLHLDSYSDYEISHRLGKSNSYVRSRYKLGLKLIGFVFWGYSKK